MTDRKVLIGVTEEGRRCGQHHPRAKLTDAQVDQIRDWHDTGMLGYRVIVRWCLQRFGVVIPRDTIRDIIKCRSRYALTMKFKTVCIKGHRGK